MNSGASLTSPIRRARRVQSSSVSWPERMWCSGTRASADSSRMVISLRLISSEKITLARSCLIGGGAGEVQREGGVVRRHHRAAGQVEVVGVVDLDAADRDAGHPPYVGDEARPGRVSPAVLVGQLLRSSRKTSSAGVKVTM